jgi:hypothetical protein
MKEKRKERKKERYVNVNVPDRILLILATNERKKERNKDRKIY